MSIVPQDLTPLLYGFCSSRVTCHIGHVHPTSVNNVKFNKRIGEPDATGNSDAPGKVQ